MKTNSPFFMPRAILFDFDGTLAQLTLDFKKMRENVEQSLRAVLSADELEGYDPKRPAVETLERLVSKLGPGRGDEVRQAVEKSLIAFEVEAARRSRLFDFTRPVLAGLGAKGISSAIITRNCRESIDIVFPDYADYCALLLSRHDVKKPKPHPEHLLDALGPLGVRPEEALMVGDHPMDVFAGKNAGCRTAGVLSGDSEAEALQASEPDYLAEDVPKLLEMLGVFLREPGHRP